MVLNLYHRCYLMLDLTTSINEIDIANFNYAKFFNQHWNTWSIFYSPLNEHLKPTNSTQSEKRNNKKCPNWNPCNARNFKFFISYNKYYDKILNCDNVAKD